MEITEGVLLFAVAVFLALVGVLYKVQQSRDAAQDVIIVTAASTANLLQQRVAVLESEGRGTVRAIDNLSEQMKEMRQEMRQFQVTADAVLRNLRSHGAAE